MRCDVPANSIAKSVLAEKALQHPQERLAFLIGDIVKRAIGFGFRCNRLLNGMGGRARVALHGRFLRDSAAPRRVSRYSPCQPYFPLRVKMRGAFGAHPGSEP